MTRAWQHELPVKVEESVCSEPHLEVDSVVEPKTVAIQETGRLELGSDITRMCGLHGPVHAALTLRMLLLLLLFVWIYQTLNRTHKPLVGEGSSPAGRCT